MPIQVPCDSVFLVRIKVSVKSYQPRPSARLITLTSTLIIPGVTKTSSSNCSEYRQTVYVSQKTFES